MIDKEHLTRIIEQHIAGTDIYLIEVVVTPGNSLRVEIDSEHGVQIQQCIELSRKIESSLDREEEDFELEVGSVGLTAPFKILRQYVKHIGKEVEVLTKDGRKLYGVLTEAHADYFVLTILKKVKPEGSKRKIEVEEALSFGYDEVKYVKCQIKFK